jgi:hypothetical protein
MQPGSIRAIEYEYFLKSQAASLGLSSRKTTENLCDLSQLGMLRCVDHQGRKLTLVGDAKQVRTLLANGQASHPDGMKPTKQAFPVVVAGWLRSS